MNKKEVEYDDIGRVTYVKKAGTRHIRIVLRPFEGIRVTVPWHVSIDAAEEFVFEKRDWIIDTLQKVEKHEQKQTTFTSETMFATRFRTLCLYPLSIRKPYARILNNTIDIYFPSHVPVTDSRVQHFIRRVVESVLRIEANAYLPGRTEMLALRCNFKYKKVVVRNNRTLWGSCTADDIINLNIHLMRLPEHISDYIILHELAHTIHKNHGKEFKQLLHDITGGYKNLEKELKGYTPCYW